jgi:beta-glucosidase
MIPGSVSLVALVALLVAGAALVGAGTTREVSAQATPAYLDPSLTPEQRADDLLPRLSLAEKVGQMTQINATVLQGDPNNPWDRAELNPDMLRLVLKDNQAGSILSGGGAAPLVNSPRAWAEMTNTIQRYAVENQEHGIPIIYGIDAVHGHNNVLGATMFPHQFGLGAAYDPALARRLARATAGDVRATGIHWDFAPSPTSGATCAGGAPTSLSARRRSRPATSSPSPCAASRGTTWPVTAWPPPSSTSLATPPRTAVATGRTPR